MDIKKRKEDEKDIKEKNNK